VLPEMDQPKVGGVDVGHNEGAAQGTHREYGNELRKNQSFREP
jgi:hypothetical protein